MKNHMFMFFCLVILSILSCKKDKKGISNEFPVRNILIDQNEMVNKNPKLSDVVENFRFVSLEKTEKSLVGRIHKIRIYDNKIFVLDMLSSKSLFVFSDTGKFLYTIGRVGNGPGEFLLPMSFTIDKKNKEVIILDGEKKRQLRYSITGEFKKSQEMSFYATGIEYYTPERFILKGTSREDNLIISNKLGEKTESYFPFTSRTESTLISNFTRIYNDSIVFYRLYMKDTIFRINNNNVSPYRTIKFKNEDKSFLRNTKIDERNIDRINNTLTDYIEKDTHIWLSYFTKKPKESFYSVCIDKRTNNKVYYERNEFVNDLFYDNYFMDTATINDSEDEIVFVIQPYRVLKKMNNKDVDKITNEATINLLKGLKETSNPVLMFAKIKSF